MHKKRFFGVLAIASSVAMIATGCSAGSGTANDASGAVKDNGSCSTITV